MASFYNRYYRYYNPYFRNRVSSYHEPDKKLISSDCHEKIDDSSCSEKDMDSSCSNKRGNSFGGFSFGPISFKNFVFGAPSEGDMNPNITIFDIKEKTSGDLNIVVGILEDKCKKQIEEARSKK